MAKCVTVTVKPTGAPNLEVTSVEPSKSTVEVGETFSIKITYTNTGDATGGSDKMVQISGAVTDKKPCVSLSPNESESFTISVTPTAAGSMKVCAKIVKARL